MILRPIKVGIEAVMSWQNEYIPFGYNISTFLPIQDNCTQDKSDNGMQFTVMKICIYVQWCKERKPNDFESGLIHLWQYFPI